MIWTGDVSALALSPGVFNARSLRRLASEKKFNDELVDGVPLLGNVECSYAYLLPSAIYTHLASGNYQRLEAWEKNLHRVSKPWIFGVCVNDHWSAINIDWTARSILHYDPMYDPSAKFPAKRSNTVLKVSNPNTHVAM